MEGWRCSSVVRGKAEGIQFSESFIVDLPCPSPLTEDVRCPDTAKSSFSTRRVQNLEASSALRSLFFELHGQARLASTKNTTMADVWFKSQSSIPKSNAGHKSSSDTSSIMRQNMHRRMRSDEKRGIRKKQDGLL